MVSATAGGKFVLIFQPDPFFKSEKISITEVQGAICKLRAAGAGKNLVRNRFPATSFRN